MAKKFLTSFKSLKNEPLFWIGLLLKLALIPFFGSGFFRNLFIPFIDTAISNLGTNPWSLHGPQYFPYGSFLFSLLFIPKFIGHLIFEDAALGQTALSFTLMKLPLLLADLMFFLTLIQFVSYQKKKLFYLYWLNPIIIFVCYIYGQLDLVATALCFASLILIIQQREVFAALLFALATLSKFHVVAILPFILIYFWNRYYAKESLLKISKFVVLWMTLSVLGFMPLFKARHFLYASTSSPEAFRLFTMQLHFGTQTILYFGVLLVLALLGRLCISSRITSNGLIFGSGAVFTALLLITQPFPGWYLWSLPYVLLFFVMVPTAPESLLYIFTASYFIHFGFEKLFSNMFFQGLTFTFLQLSLFSIFYFMWKLVVERNVTLYGRLRPMLIGLAGDSGSGKNYLSALIKDIFTKENTVVLEGDDYHKWERTNVKWRDYSHLNPRANHLLHMAEHTKQLSHGSGVLNPHYDHSSGTFTLPREILPTKTVILQGLHTFYLKTLRSRFDFKIFLDPHAAIRTHWKIKRDVHERGAHPEKVLESIESRMADAKQHIEPQRQYADCIIQYHPNNETSLQDVVAGKMPEYHVRYVLWNDLPVYNLVSLLSEMKNVQSVEYDTDATDINRCYLKVNAQLTLQDIQEISSRLFENLRQVTRSKSQPTWKPGYDGLTQILVLLGLEQKLEGSV